VFNAVKEANLLPEDPERWPSRSLLSQTLGSSDIIVPQNIHRDVDVDEFYFLCTDGIYESLDQEEIGFYLTQPSYLELICEDIVQAALDSGAEDNLTAVGFKLRPFELEQDILAASLAKTVVGV
jgi:protein phosphatase